MVFISLRPFVARRVFALIAAIVALLTVTALAVEPVCVSVDATPYDRQMSRIEPVLRTARLAGSGQPAMTLVNQWMQHLHAIPYVFCQQWQLPQEVTAENGSDCKGKAVALYQQMRMHGADNVRLVVGQRTPTSRTTHVWLEWQTTKGDLILDPTFDTSPRAREVLPRDSYQALFAYSADGKYRVQTAAAIQLAASSS